MRLRAATMADIPEMVRLGRRVHAESRFAAFPYGEEKLARNLEQLIGLLARGSHFFVVAESQDGKLIGGFIGALEEYFFTSAKSAMSILIWVDPDYRGSAAALRMVSAFRDWGKKRGALEACVLVASGVHIARTDRFLRRLGFAQTGGNYAVALAGTP